LIIIKAIKADIICINETHLSGAAQLQVDGYTWCGFNRVHKHKNAPITHGGVGILIKNSLLFDFTLAIIDKSHDGILCIKLKHRYSGLELLVFAIYLPPETGIWGRDANSFYNHLLSLMYLYSDVELCIVCGDVNGRIGNKKDFIPEIDDLPTRKHIDDNVNQHGNALIEFLLESKMCVINGRGNPNDDNFTYISPRGRSVVDYIMIPHNIYERCSNFQVRTPTDIIDSLNLTNLLGTRCRAPDHSLLEMELDVGCDIQTDQSEESAPSSTRRFDRRRITENTWSNDAARLTTLIDRIELTRQNQAGLDRVYNEFAAMIQDKMKQLDPNFDCTRQVRKRFKSRKPFWNEELKVLWQTMKAKEKEFLRVRSPRARSEKKNTLQTGSQRL
jgi:hypothetical protein